MGQLENTVKLGRCTRRRASFVIRLAIASICRPPRFRHQGNPALIVMLLSSDLLHTAVRHPIFIVKAPLTALCTPLQHTWQAGTWPSPEIQQHLSDSARCSFAKG